ncbi:transposase family protein [Sphaerisporangium melleum]|uniref:transposase family protein n=1 Tax=Sphaerisporangium melleum TaxID=321316 RepID=UPI00166426A2|nr:transposase family protein [Sphaerisporangium melleum]
MLFYRAALPLSHQTLSYLSGLIRRHRTTIGSPWRRLNLGRQALLVLVHLRKGEILAEVASGSGVGTATAWRYIREAITLLARRPPSLNQALRAARRARHAFVVLDGTLIPIDRVAADRPYYSGKNRMHGMHIQVISAPDGTPLRTSGSLPGSVHDLTAARIWGIIRRLEAADLIALADKAYVDAGQRVLVPYKGRGKLASQKNANSAHAKLRGPGERANAQLKNRRILRKLRCCPLRAGQLVKAILVLQLREAG